MQFLTKLFPTSSNGENAVAVKIYYTLTSVKDLFKKLKKPSKSQWPYYSGNYQVINPKGKIAICTLSSDNLMPKTSLSENIAIIGTVITSNLGIEKIILNIISNPNISHLILCGKDSPIFKAGQAFESLFKYGVDKEKRIINAEGHFPVLKNLNEEKINCFKNQIELISLKEEKRAEIIQQKINEINLNTSPFQTTNLKAGKLPEKENFTELKIRGKRVPLEYDKNGFFVISVDMNKKLIIVKHYYKDNQPGFIIKGRSPETILLTILKKELISQMSHAGYLGAELSKAKTAIKMNLKYTQDQPLKAM